jgi:hypothetical protein
MRPTAIWMGLASAVLAACDGEPAAPAGKAPAANAPAAKAAGPEPEVLALDQLAARVKQAQGRGTLVSVWATW